MDLAAWCSQYQIEAFKVGLTGCGVDSPLDLIHLSSTDLNHIAKACKMNFGPKGRFLGAVHALRENPNRQLLHRPLPTEAEIEAPKKRMFQSSNLAHSYLF